MLIILTDLPTNITRKDIEVFINVAIEGGYMDSLSIMLQRNLKTHDVKYHGLVRIRPDSVAKQAVEELNGKQIKGRIIAVHEFQARLWYHDRRVKTVRTNMRNMRNMRRSKRRQFL
jgi:hypothetical protein